MRQTLLHLLWLEGMPANTPVLLDSYRDLPNLPSFWVR